MKKLLLIPLLSIIFWNCSEEEPPLYTITIPIVDFEVPSALSVFQEHYILGNDGFPVVVNIAQQLEAAGYDLANINKILPGSARLSANFNQVRLEFVRAMSIRVCQDIPSNGICNQEVFYRDPVPNDAGFAVNLVPSAVNDIQETVLTSQLYFQLRLEELWESPPQSFTARLEIDFIVR